MREHVWNKAKLCMPCHQSIHVTYLFAGFLLYEIDVCNTEFFLSLGNQMFLVLDLGQVVRLFETSHHLLECVLGFSCGSFGSGFFLIVVGHVSNGGWAGGTFHCRLGLLKVRYCICEHPIKSMSDKIEKRESDSVLRPYSQSCESNPFLWVLPSSKSWQSRRWDWTLLIGDGS